MHLPIIRVSGVKEFEGCHSASHIISEVILMLYMNSQREKSGVINTWHLWSAVAVNFGLRNEWPFLLSGQFYFRAGTD